MEITDKTIKIEMQNTSQNWKLEQSEGQEHQENQESK